MKRFLSQIPIPMAGVALGLAALGNLLQSVAGELRVFCGVMSLVLLLLVIAKFIRCPSVIMEDFKNPVIASVSATIFMTVMQLATYAYPYIGTLAFVIWGAAVIAHIALIIHYTKFFLLRFRLDEVFPTCFITYVGIVVTSVTSPVFGMETLGRAIFWFGLLAYVVMFALISLRYFKHEVHESLKPLFCIYTAPMSLTITGYMAVMGDKNLAAMIVMEVLAQLLYLAVLTQLPKLLRLQFYPSYAAFTFPFVITATALKQVLAHLSGFYAVPQWLNIVVGVETLIAAALVGYTVIHYLYYLFNCIANGLSPLIVTKTFNEREED